MLLSVESSLRTLFINHRLNLFNTSAHFNIFLCIFSCLSHNSKINCNWVQNVIIFWLCNCANCDFCKMHFQIQFLRMWRRKWKFMFNYMVFPWDQRVFTWLCYYSTFLYLPSTSSHEGRIYFSDIPYLCTSSYTHRSSKYWISLFLNKIEYFNHYFNMNVHINNIWLLSNLPSGIGVGWMRRSSCM